MKIRDADRARWRALTEAATPGPWWPDHRCVGVGSDDPSQGEAAGLGWEVLRDRETRERAWPEPSLRGTFARGWDAHFVAEARTALPALLDENDRLRTALAAIVAEADDNDRYGSHLPCDEGEADGLDRAARIARAAMGEGEADGHQFAEEGDSHG